MSTRVLSRDDAQIEPMRWLAADGSLMEGTPESGSGQSIPSPCAAVEAALAQARAELARLTAETPRQTQAARQSGFAEGQAQAEKKAREEYGAALLRLARSVDEIAAYKPRLRREAEQDVVMLAMAVARRILHRELTIDAGALHGVIAAALQSYESRETVKVRVSAESYPDLQKSQNQIGSPRPWELVADPTLPAGAAVLETARGQLDASVETQLAEIGRGFADRLGRSL